MVDRRVPGRKVTSKAPSPTKYLVLDSSPILRKVREDRIKQVSLIRGAQTRRYNDSLKKAIAVALTPTPTTTSHSK